MAAVFGLEARIISDIVGEIEGAWVANDNAPGQVVVSGTHEALERASAAIEGAGARRVVALKVAGPFHCPLMAPVQEAFADILESAEFSDAEIPAIQNTHPTPEVKASAIREHLSTQIASPVRWTETMRTLASDGPVTLIEAGPGSVLTGLARDVEDITAYSVESAGLEYVIEEVS
jgi:[acyl-carrier-protein] S-malonyltransferase